MGRAAAGRQTGALLGTYEDAATPAELRLVGDGASTRCTHPRRAPSAPPRTCVPRTSRTRRSTAPRSRRSCSARRAPRPRRPCPAVVYPHGGPTSCYGDEWDGHAQYFVDKGYAWLAINFRGSTGYGREFERLNHGDWGVGRHEGLPRRRGLPPHARLGRRRPARHLRRELRLVPGAARGHGRSGAPLPLRRAASTATATSSPRGRRATARASRTWGG